MTRTHRRRGHAALALCLAGLAACGGSDETDEAGPTTPSAASSDANSADEQSASGDEPTIADASSETETDGSVPEPVGDSTPDISTATFEPSEVRWRSVNLLDEPVDVYVLTDGIREAWNVTTSVAPGAVTDFTSPPVGGRYLVTTAGAGDPTCVIDCEHHIVEASNSFPESGPVRTVLLHPDLDDGTPAAFETAELVVPDGSTGFSSPMPPADPTTTLLSVTALAVTNADGGMRLAVDGATGCLTHLTGDSRVIGGNQILTFATGQAASFSIHEFDDSECDATPVGGPFPIEAAPGVRFHAFLHGDAASLEALLVPMVDGLPDTSVDADPTARSEAIDLMAAEVTTTFGLDGDASTCAAELIVDRIGPDVLVVNGVLVDLDSLSNEVNALAGAALVAAVDECGIDPAVFGA